MSSVCVACLSPSPEDGRPLSGYHKCADCAAGGKNYEMRDGDTTRTATDCLPFDADVEQWGYWIERYDGKTQWVHVRANDVGLVPTGDLLCRCGERVTDENLRAILSVHGRRPEPSNVMAAHASLADCMGDLSKERDDALKRVGELEMELTRMRRRAGK